MPPDQRRAHRALYLLVDGLYKGSSSKPIEFRKSNAGAARRRRAFKVHRLRNEAPDPLRRFDKVPIGKVGVARRRPVSLVAEHLPTRTKRAGPRPSPRSGTLRRSQVDG